MFVLNHDIRKVQVESSTGSSSSSKVRTTLTVQVESIDFDTQACALRVKGRNVEENDYVKVLCVLIHDFSCSGSHIIGQVVIMPIVVERLVDHSCSVSFAISMWHG
jgi:protein pelota